MGDAGEPAAVAEEELVLPEKKKKRPALPISELDEPPSEEAPKTAAALTTVSWAEFDFPKKKKRKREVSWVWGEMCERVRW